MNIDIYRSKILGKREDEGYSLNDGLEAVLFVAD
jgi:hypothetical protein